MWNGIENRIESRREDDESLATIITQERDRKLGLVQVEETIENRRKFNERRAEVTVAETQKFIHQALDVFLSDYQVEVIIKYIRRVK